MRSITFVQAFQYWLKLTAHRRAGDLPVVAWQAHGAQSLTAPEHPAFPQDTIVQVQESVDLIAPSAVAVLVDDCSGSVTRPTSGLAGSTLLSGSL